MTQYTEFINEGQVVWFGIQRGNLANLGNGESPRKVFIEAKDAIAWMQASAFGDDRHVWEVRLRDVVEMKVVPASLERKAQL